MQDFPLPLAGKIGWPWTEAASFQTVTPEKLPKITIVTPSFNQAHYLEETIRSVLLQNYPFLEYIIIDGGSSDGSEAILKRYDAFIDFWVSEPDQGQSDALCKGFARANGEIVAWLNSDDLLEPGALLRIGQAYAANPGAIIAGNVVNFNSVSGQERVIRQSGLSTQNLIRLWRHDFVWHQPGLFFPRAAYEEVGGIDVNLTYAMDHDLFIRLLQICPVVYLDETVARFRLHDTSKTVAQNTELAIEVVKVARRYESLLSAKDRRFLEWKFRLPLLKHAAKQLLAGNKTALQQLLRALSDL
ncbi:MAG: glycosyltransferase family 2 protein [Candidatus Promineifilaceae bacterium]|nr:glycosyltransferase family 2 protein [Candidatus Promineifilaceae bacterium]